MTYQDASLADFAVLDLYGQRDALLRFTHGWTQDEILSWLQNFGELGSLKLPNGSIHYGFKSHCGITGGFWFDEEGKWCIPHATHIVKRI